SQQNISKDNEVEISNTIKIDSTNFKDFIRSLPAFTMYGDNYFITGTSTESDAFTTAGSDAKFEIGFKQRLTNVNLPWDIFPFITYRQKAFWDIYRESLPFRETNYNPAIGFSKLFFRNRKFNYALHFAFEHESNGRDGENSRSWNFFSLSYLKPVGTNFQLRAKAWLPIGDISDNADITSYRGFFSVGATYKAGKDVYFDLDLQPAYDKKLQGHIKAGVSLKIPKISNQFIYLQYFGGYSEDLIDYNESVSNLRLGIVFKDLTFNFRDFSAKKSKKRAE
ncbi:MAG: phospholipase A, partial [Bacteroidota bacterium]